ncbi:sigma 54-interacting transcriptional regulator [Candidatus Nitrospira nitrificans]|uniref:Putative transmembrane signal transduction receptor and sigma-54 dependent response regulator n=1 Tax=Candidatus Nitrospira nitrificans TaxID=1742973 RepID=A0A0S4LK18_9BACT|nr:sigma 54-interacting transcriptional regulator [Candidatus Nitrospira nitrificans]CUS37900.1 putative transmembrane signal transduction receptor and sigma-54 dependent response regulator [Candidatus Nitrospira nitrificans]
MRLTSLDNHGAALVIGIVSALVVVMLYILMPNLISSWELSTYDLRMQLRGSVKLTSQLVIIARDDVSDEEIGVGIWNRQVFAKVIDALHRAGARVIALDFDFSQASPKERGGESSDQALISAMRQSHTVFLPLQVTQEQESETSVDRTFGLNASVFLEKGVSHRPPFLLDVPRVGQVFPPMFRFLSEANGIGHVAAIPDIDGGYRRTPAFVRSGDVIIPALGVSLAAAYLGVSPEAIELTPEKTLVFKGAIASDGMQRDLSIPVDLQGNVLLDYAGRWEGETEYFPIIDVLNKIENEKDGIDGLRKTVQGKAVLIIHAAIEADKRRTPLELKAPGGFILANTFNTIVTERKLHLLPVWEQWGLTGVLAIFVAWSALLLQGWRSLVGVSVLGVLYIAGAYGAFAWFGMVAPIVVPMVGLVVASGGALTWTSWLGLGQVREAESKRMALQQEVMGLHGLREKQEARIRQLEAASAAAQSARLTQEQALNDSQHLLVEQVDYVKRLEGELAIVKGAPREQGVPSAEERERLEIELRRAKEELVQTENRAVKWQNICEYEAQARERLETELRLAKAEREKTDQTIASSPAKRTSLWAHEPSHTALSADEKKKLQDLCEEDIITSDPGLLHCLKDLEKVAQSMVKIMFLGEPGTGKERFAFLAHKWSDRKGRPFVPVNMAAIPPDLFESQLFGHKKGSFTGAIANHDGYFLQADTGTLFLDEIGDLNFVLQAKLLRVLQDGFVTRVGEKEAIRVDVRVVSATNKDLSKEIAEGRFRQDLYDRLCGIEMRLPPLRERMGDVPKLAQLFLGQAAVRNKKPNRPLSNDASARLQTWTWPGNVRELEKCLERAVLLAEGSEITERDLGLGRVSDELVVPPTATPSSPMIQDTDDIDLSLEELEFLRAMRQHCLTIGNAADELDWSRDTVTEWWKGLCFKALVYHQFDREKAAASLAGESGLTKLVLKKLNEYVKGLNKVVSEDPPSSDFRAWCKQHFKNLPACYYPAIDALIRARIV